MKFNVATWSPQDLVIAWTPDADCGHITAIDLEYGLVKISYSVFDWDDDSHLPDYDSAWCLIEDVQINDHN